MKKILNIVFIVTFNIFSQSGVVYYSKAYTKQNKLVFLDKINYELSFNNSTSLMKLQKDMELDDLSIHRFAYKGGGKGIYFKDLKTKIRIHELEFNDELLTVNKPFEPYKWVLLNETKKICGYTCFKAIAEVEEQYSVINKVQKETVTAWYAPNINYPFGPLDRDGLPGLVLETSYKNIYYIAKKIKLNYSQKIDIKKPHRGKKISEENYQEKISMIVDLIKDKLDKVKK